MKLKERLKENILIKKILFKKELKKDLMKQFKEKNNLKKFKHQRLKFNLRLQKNGKLW